MTMTSFDNAPPLDGFIAPPGRHCGQLCVDFSCPICGENVVQPLDGRGEN